MANSGAERVDIAMFDDALEKFKTAISVFDSAMSTMNSQTQTLLNNWEGKGKDAFSDAYTQLKTAIKDETENLVAIRDDLQAIKDSYVDWDTESGKVIGENTAG